jgi:hypothetical protein
VGLFYGAILKDFAAEGGALAQIKLAQGALDKFLCSILFRGGRTDLLSQKGDY